MRFFYTSVQYKTFLLLIQIILSSHLFTGTYEGITHKDSDGKDLIVAGSIVRIKHGITGKYLAADSGKKYPYKNGLTAYAKTGTDSSTLWEIKFNSGIRTIWV